MIQQKINSYENIWKSKKKKKYRHRRSVRKTSNKLETWRVIADIMTSFLFKTY